jgi:hypothetical protein
MKSFKAFLLSCALMLYGIVTIATSAAVWNSNPTATLAVIAGLNLAANGYVIYRKALALAKTIKENGGLK